MAIVANVAFTDTVENWRTKTNQAIKIVNDVELGVHPYSNLAIQASQTANNIANTAGNLGYELLVSNTAFMNAVVANSAILTANILLSNTQTQNILNIAAASYVESYLNSVNFDEIYVTANAAYGQGNTARTQANAAYAQANVALGSANTVLDVANAAFAAANAGLSQQSTVIFGVVNAAYSQANTGTNTAVAAYGQANTAVSSAVAAFLKGNTAHAQANTGTSIAQAAFNTANVGQISTGTRMIFCQNTAPVGWTKETTFNDHALRVVGNLGGSTGGTLNFSAVMASRAITGSVTMTGAIGATTLSTSEMPSHTHPLPGGGGTSTGTLRVDTGNRSTSVSISTNAAGGGGSHSHSLGTLAGTLSAPDLDMRVKYLNVITATKD